MAKQNAFKIIKNEEKEEIIRTNNNNNHHHQLQHPLQFITDLNTEL